MKLIKTEEVKAKIKYITNREKSQAYTDHEQAWFLEIDRTTPRDKQGRLILGPNMWEFSNYPPYSALGRWEMKVLKKDRVGFFRLDQRRNLVYNRRAVFYGKCDCGHEGYYAAADLVGRTKMGFGCARFACSAPPPFFRLWYDPEAAIRLQVSQAQAACPAYRDEVFRYSVPFEDEVERLFSAWKDWDVHNYGGGPWLLDCTQLHEAEAQFCKRPSESLFPAAEILFDTPEGAFTEEELALVFHIDTAKALEHKFLGWDSDLFDSMIA